jgi:hypothetical protein
VSKLVANQRSYSDLTQGVWFAPIGTAIPTGPLPTAWGAGWQELGFLTDKGVIESAARQKTKKWNWQGGSSGRSLYNQPEHTFAIECNEENSHVLRLARPGSTVSATGGTAEVQTITLTGTGTAGTWTVTLPGYGSTASGLTYNIATAALATALSSAFGITVTVTGTAGTSYVVTFPAANGNVPLMTTTNAIAGVTSITTVETTPGVNAINTTNVKAYTGTDFWMFGIDLVDGSIHKRYVVPIGDATLTGSINYVGTDLTIYAFTIDCYPDTNGTLVVDLNDNPALSALS